MKTASKIFATLFLILGLIAAAAALTGATHQWFTVALCAVVSIALALDSMDKEDADNTPRLFS